MRDTGSMMSCVHWGVMRKASNEHDRSAFYRVQCSHQSPERVEFRVHEGGTVGMYNRASEAE